MMKLLIEDQNTLNAFCQQLHKEDSRGFITVDTEFKRRDTYWSELCLIQIAGSKSQACIDTLAKGIDFQPVFDLMLDPNIIKVMHSARQDLEIFYQLMSDLPKPLYDTQEAAYVCGMGLSQGYAQLVEDICKVHIDKSQRYTDWSKRPLSAPQIDYAMDDVIYLRDVYQHLITITQGSPQSIWLQQRHDALTDFDLYNVDPMSTWKKIKCRSDSPAFLNHIQHLAAARERIAIENNRPRRHIVGDDQLLRISADPKYYLKNPDKLKTLGVKGKLADAILEAINSAKNVPESLWPQRQKKAEKKRFHPMTNLALQWVDQVAKALNAPQDLLMSGDDLQRLLIQTNMEKPEWMTGWQFETIGKDLLAIKAGRVVLGFKNDAVTLIMLPPSL